MQPAFILHKFETFALLRKTILLRSDNLESLNRKRIAQRAQEMNNFGWFCANTLKMAKSQSRMKKLTSLLLLGTLTVCSALAIAKAMNYVFSNGGCDLRARIVNTRLL